MQEFISGIQQIGIGVRDVNDSLHRYARLFGMDALVFDDVSEADLMAQYTGGKTYKRHAVMALNLQGGGGFELWQFKNRQPLEAVRMPQYGDVGIYAARLKSADVVKAFHHFLPYKNLTLTPLERDGRGDLQFYVSDEGNNQFQVVASHHFFLRNSKPVGGVCGAVIGVTNMERSLAFYKMLLTGAEVHYDIKFAVGEKHYRKILLRTKTSCKGAFAQLLGPIEIELVQCLNYEPLKIFANRYWGDCGFIHLCFDVFDMDGLQKHAEAFGYKFTVDSYSSFRMEGAAGRFCYMEDPDGTLIELVETHKVPIIKKYGWYLDLKKRNLSKPLPRWMIKLLALNKVK